MLLLKGVELETIVEKLRFKHPDLFVIHYIGKFLKDSYAGIYQE